MNRYLWAVGATAMQIPAGELVKDRYEVIATQIWRDTQPEQLPEIPDHLSADILKYLRLSPHRLHLPEVYGVCEWGESVVVLLENVPLDANGELYPTIRSMWTQVPAMRQVYWLWQILDLWTPLEDMGVASSLLVPDNLRVEGWRVRLRELYADAMGEEAQAALVTSGMSASDGLETAKFPTSSSTLLRRSKKASLQQLGELWMNWCTMATNAVPSRLQAIAQKLQSENPVLEEIAADLNKLLLEQAARQSLRLKVAGATDAGALQNHNEDSCYPTLTDLPADLTLPRDPLIPHLSIICDGIGGHEGGEVASQLAVQSIKLQIRALLAELAEDPEIMTPELVKQQLAAIIRVANNLIASRNDAQSRESRRRMATTLTLALQLPQIIRMPDGQGNAHELYIASVGDSPAYWLTPDYCQRLTVDEVVATREVRLGRSLYRKALQRPDAGALTQAVGTKDAELLRPTVQRFILEEDGLLLLCSDGLSDHNLIERFCAEYPKKIFSGELSLEAAVKELIDLANQNNGHDNTSVVLTYCSVTPQYPVVLNLGELPVGTKEYTFTLDTEFPATAENLENSELDTPTQPEPKPASSTGEWFKVLAGIVGVLLVLFLSGAALLTIQWLVSPEGFKKMRDREQQSERLDPSRVSSTMKPPPEA
jgi:serine/threonine protein phosphatase PrpC